LYIANRRRSGVLGDIALDLAQDPTTLLSGPAAELGPPGAGGPAIDLTELTRPGGVTSGEARRLADDLTVERA
jgi:hypothetical protein